MRIAYFDCFAGISGDMTLGALIDAGLNFELLKSDLAKLHLHDYEIRQEKVIKQGMTGTKIHVLSQEGHIHRHLQDITRIIEDSELVEEVKKKAITVFRRLAEAEGKVHGTSPEQVHFHEVGAVDAIIDIVGAVIGLWHLGIEKVYASALHTGRGFTKAAHGTIPIPAPATLELLRGIPIYTQDIPFELVTPTGAAILTTYCHDYGDMPVMEVERIGYGAGDRELSIPNLLRMMIGERSEKIQQENAELPPRGDVRFFKEQTIQEGQALMIEANIDDMNPEFYDYLIQKFLKEGAMDVFLQPIQMKKNRPAITLSVQIHPTQLEKFKTLILKETTTIGVRVYPVTKYMLPYQVLTVNTPWGKARVKVVRAGEEYQTFSPEYEDCRLIAETHNLPLKEVYDEVKRRAFGLIDRIK
ncbi:nickel pincer cofactor biosynthesis protein LarC [Desulfitobacterium sp.]|uniref:nickel pincer cofactor biosynthesis protein LarC n=1 Tax=Desulfitobacterium sp. TaxID=49981 RepID=UPI002D1BAC7B|nr:nickel pincer cofactor biosynthesis protein LarC [Desulfitobacterium sp.]HVJ48048.1 nickel pincer cofactor biosynthesis protein LarC [Desulfitobacterium sp.]